MTVSFDSPVSAARRERSQRIKRGFGRTAGFIGKMARNPLTAIGGSIILLLLIVAIVVALVALVMRTIALLLLIVLLPLTLAGTAGPKTTRDWFTSALRMFVALLLAKPLIVVANSPSASGS